MRSASSHEGSEVIAKHLDDCIDLIRRSGLAGSREVEAHYLRLLRSVCRAATHDRLPLELRAKYRGLLRDVRPHVLRLQRAGSRIPDIVVTEVENAWKS